jgi:hypothetical protein
MYAGIRTGDAVHRVLDAVGWPADLRDIDPGATVMPWWWLDDVEAFTRCPSWPTRKARRR